MLVWLLAQLNGRAGILLGLNPPSGFTVKSELRKNAHILSPILMVWTCVDLRCSPFEK